MWMLKIFLGFENFRRPKYQFLYRQDVPLPDIDHQRISIYFEPSGSYEKSANLAKHFRGLHVIRDPRDVIISGAFYHMRSSEHWLHLPRDDCNGSTYQELIKELDPESALFFEMERYGAHTIRQMANWDYSDSRFLNVKYEDLMRDEKQVLFESIFQFLGLNNNIIQEALAHTKSNTISPGDERPKDPHVRSGAPEQWRQTFKRAHGRRFLELFGNVLIDLGYEHDHSWIDSLPRS